MPIFIDAHDPRGPRAVALALQALRAGWPSIRCYHMPSSDGKHVYLSTRISCECADFRFHGRAADGTLVRRCYHSLAVLLLDQLDDEVAAF